MANTLNRCLRLLALALVLAWAATPAERLRAEDLNGFLHTQTSDISVGTLYTDKEGTMWVGSSQGLMTYDEFRSGTGFRSAMPKPLQEPVYLIFGLNDGKMLVVMATRNMYIFDPETYSATKIDSEWLESHGVGGAQPWDVYVASMPEAEAVIIHDHRIYSYDVLSAYSSA